MAAGALSGAARWLFAPLPRGRVAALRTLVYAFVLVDLFHLRPWVEVHGKLPPAMYDPIFFGDLLSLPVPTESYVRVLQVVLVAGCVSALAGRLPRLSGVAVAVAYLLWSFVAFSYGKVDHDSVAFLVALAVLPAAGPARWGEREETDAAGWAIRSIQVAVVVTYFASVFAKLRFGGIAWPTGSTFMRAVLRRGTPIVEPLLDHPMVLRAGQFALVTFEMLSPLLLVRGRVGKVMLVLALSFHVVTFASLKIMFWPHVLCLCAFLPLERLEPARVVHRLRSRLGPAAASPEPRP